MKTETICQDFLEPKPDMNDPIVATRYAKLKRLEKIREVCNNALARQQYTRQELFQVCIRERIVDIGTYRQFMRDLIQLEADGLIHTMRIKVEKKNRRPPTWFSGVYLRKIMECIRNSNQTWETKARLCVALLLGLRQAMRSGEISRLKWFRIKFDEDKIVVWNSKFKDRSKTKFNEGKTRVMMLMPDMKKVLKKYKQYMGVSDDDTWVFPSPTNPDACLKPKTISGWFGDILNSIGLRKKSLLVREPYMDRGGKEKRTYLYKFHTLRHTSAYHILLVTNGDYHTAQAFLGHESSNTTRDSYAGLLYHQVGDKILAGEKKGLRNFQRNLSIQHKVERMDKIVDARINYQEEQRKKEEIAIDKQIELERLRLERERLQRDSRMKETGEGQGMD